MNALDDPFKLAMIMAGLGMMSARTKNVGNAIGQGGLLGIQGYNAAQNHQLARKRAETEDEFRRMQMDSMRGQMAEQQSMQQAHQAASAAATQPAVGPPTPQGEMQPGGFDFAKYHTMMAPKTPQQSYAALAGMQPKDEEWSPEPRTVMLGGKPTLVFTSKSGKIKPVGADPTPKLTPVDRGNAVEMVDELNTQPGASFSKSMTPGQVAENKIAQANLGLRAEQNRIAADANAATREVGGGQAARETGKLVADLRKEVNALPQVKNYNAVVPIIKSAETAPDTKAGDLQLIYGVGKILDPDSVVREGEMVLVTKTGSPAQRIMGYMNYLRGRGQLTPEHRKQLREMLKGRVDELKRSRDAAVSPYSRQADMMKLPKDQIFEPPTIDELVDQYTR
jgi:hypothetical protein